MFDVKNAFCSLQLFTACQSSTDRKGGQAVPSLCNQCWGFCGGPTAIPDYSQNVRTLYYSMVNRVEEVVVNPARCSTMKIKSIGTHVDEMLIFTYFIPSVIGLPHLKGLHKPI